MGDIGAREFRLQLPVAFHVLARHMLMAEFQLHDAAGALMFQIVETVVPERHRFDIGARSKGVDVLPPVHHDGAGLAVQAPAPSPARPGSASTGPRS